MYINYNIKFNENYLLLFSWFKTELYFVLFLKFILINKIVKSQRFNEKKLKLKCIKNLISYYNNTSWNCKKQKILFNFLSKSLKLYSVKYCYYVFFCFIIIINYFYFIILIWWPPPSLAYAIVVVSILAFFCMLFNTHYC